MELGVQKRAEHNRIVERIERREREKKERGIQGWKERNK